MRIRVVLLLVTGCALAAAPSAPAGSNSGVEEYVETLPGPRGDERPDGATAPDPATAPLPSGVQTELEASGDDGEAAARLARKNRPEGDDGRELAPGPGEATTDATAGLPVSEEDSGGGFVLPLVLGLTLVGALGFAVARRARAGASS